MFEVKGGESMRLNKAAIELAMAVRGFSKVELAKEMGTSRQVVWLHLGRDSVRPKTAKRFADALGVPVQEIVTQDEYGTE